MARGASFGGSIGLPEAFGQALTCNEAGEGGGFVAAWWAGLDGVGVVEVIFA